MELRFGIRSAVTWRIVAELIRRHGKTCGLRVLETHPGGGQYDCLSLGYGPNEEPFREHLCDFNIASQHLHVFSTYGQPRPQQVRWPDFNDYAIPCVTAEDPRDIVNQAESLLGLPESGNNITPATPTSVALRVVATVLERAALDRHPLEARCAWLDSSGVGGSRVRDWIRDFPALSQKLAELSPGAGWQEVARIAGRAWRVGRVGGSRGVLVDIGSGTAYVGDNSVQPVQLLPRYLANGHKVSPLATLLQQHLDE